MTSSRRSPTAASRSSWWSAPTAAAARSPATVDAVPDFLDLPARPSKPPADGVTHVIDTGLSTAAAAGLMALAADHIDVVRLGWGSAYVTGDLQAKLDTYRAAGVPVMLGGTLTELSWLRGRVDGLVDWLRELEIGRVEVSSGTVAIPPAAKLRLFERLPG